MLISTITSKGQITLPVKLRKELGVEPSDKIVFARKNGDILLQKLPSIDSIFGSLSNPKVRPLTVQQMNKLTNKGMFNN